MEHNAHLRNGIPSRTLPTYDHLQYSDFLNNHQIPNTPFVLSCQNTSSWSSTQKWRQPQTTSSQASSSIHKPNLSSLRRYENQIVPVANTLRVLYSEFEREEMRLGDVLDLWEDAGFDSGEAGDECPENSAAGRVDQETRRKRNGLYVKDWHLLDTIERQGRSVQEVYEVPECFRDDWLNPPYSLTSRHSFPDQSERRGADDFRFVYLGPAGTYTPLHRDVYSSYSWSANIVGRKVWWLFPPDRLEGLRQKNGDVVFDVRDLEGEGRGIKILQEEGEVIFVPSGWYHQVLNVDFCISINHNFFSSPTLPHIYIALCASQTRVETSIADVKKMIISRLGLESGEWEKEWIEEVQGLLERDAGWGWRGFWDCVRGNIKVSPSGEGLRPGTDMRDGYVRGVVERYKERREWVILGDVREIVEDVERMIRSARRHP